MPLLFLEMLYKGNKFRFKFKYNILILGPLLRSHSVESTSALYDSSKLLKPFSEQLLFLTAEDIAYNSII